MRTIPQSVLPRRDGLRFSAPLRVGSAREFVATSRWVNVIPPANDQGNEPSCEGWASSNWMDCMAREYTPRNRLTELTGNDPWQFDGRAAWVKARQMFHGGSLDGGLQLGESFAAMIAMGWLPQSAKIVRIPADPAEVAHMLRSMPLVQGTATHRGWFEPHPKSGQIPLHYTPDPYAGHATLVCGILEKLGHRWMIFQNQWTNEDGTPWGRFGYGQERWDQYVQWALDDMVGVDVPREWWAGGAWMKGVVPA